MYLGGLTRRFYARAALLAKGVLQGGLTPQKLSLTLCLGIGIGAMPLLWGTTILCVALAGVFKLNQGALQAVNYCCYPLQLALFLPLCRLGERLFPWGPKVESAVLTGALHGHFAASAALLGWVTVRGLGAWLVTVAPLALLAHPILKWVLRRREAHPPNPAALLGDDVGSPLGTEGGRIQDSPLPAR